MFRISKLGEPGVAPRGLSFSIKTPVCNGYSGSSVSTRYAQGSYDRGNRRA